MSKFSDDFAASALPDLMSELGDAGCSYTPKGVAAVSLTAIVGDEEIEEEKADGGRVKVRKRRATITTDPASSFGGVAAPAMNATFTPAGGAEYAIADIHPLGVGYVELRLERREAIERTRQNYRGR